VFIVERRGEGVMVETEERLIGEKSPGIMVVKECHVSMFLHKKII